MKTLLALLLLTLMCLLHHSSASSHLFRQQKSCCPRAVQIRVPKNKVKHVEMTPDNCPEEERAIVVTTCVGKKLCIDPNWAWAGKLLQEFKNSKAPFNQC